MKRLTMDNVEEMGMYELSHNCCYIDKEGFVRYRDFTTDVDARELVRDLMLAYGACDPDDAEMDLTDIDYFDEVMLENTMYPPTQIEGLIAMYYKVISGMARLRERLKRYEDLEEHPRKTFLQDFLEKYPKAPLDRDGTPRACPEIFGYLPLDYVERCGGDCIACWNQPLDVEG